MPNIVLAEVVDDHTKLNLQGTEWQSSVEIITW